MHEDSLHLMEPLAFEPLPETVLDLEPAHLAQARQWSLAISDREAQWQTYLNGLALLGLEQWLTQRALVLDWSQSSLLHPLYQSVIPAVCNLQVKAFTLCLIATESQPDDLISLPAAATLPGFNAHFYVLMAVAEEQAQVQVQGVLRYDQLCDRLPALTPEADWTYSLPLNWFDPAVDRLLLYLRCAEPAAIVLPSDAPSTADLAPLQATLLERLPQVAAGDRPWWHWLTWEEGAAVLSQPSLVQWLSQGQPTATQHLADLLQLLTQPLINTRLWLQGQVDAIAQQLAWALLPPIATGMRLGVGGSSRTEDFEAVLTHLARTGLVLPTPTGGICHSLKVGSVPTRFYAVVGALPTGEWTLLVILGPELDQDLPYGTALRVSDVSGILVQQVLTPPTEDRYLFAQITGSPEEQFLVTLTVPEGASLTLPPFSFHA